MKTLRLIALFALVLTLPASCISEETSAAPQDIVVPGLSLPDFSVTLSDGTALSPATLAGRVAVVVFFNTHCGDCRRELPKIEELYRSYGRDSVAIACISRAEGADEVASYWKEQGFTMPFSAQPDRSVYELFARSGVPRTYIADRQGIVRLVYGEAGATTGKLRDDIEALCRGGRIY